MRWLGGKVRSWGYNGLLIIAPFALPLWWWWEEVVEFTRAHQEWGGSPSFITACTGINLALTSWDKFQKKLRSAETKMNEMVSARILTARDSGQPVQENFFKAIIPYIARGNKRLWYFAHVTAIGAVIAGLVLLYLNKSCPWNVLLLLPSALYLGWTSIMLGAVWLWVTFVLGLHGIAHDEKVLEAVREFGKTQAAEAFEADD